MARKINKNKNKKFVIIASLLAIVALAFIVPLSISSIRENLDTRNQAYKGTTPSIPNEDFLYINTSSVANYLETRWESANFQLRKDTTYALQTAFIPYNLVDGPAAGDNDSGLHIAIVCAEADGKCSGLTPGSEINVNELLAEIPVPKTNVPENKLGTYMFRNLRPFKMPADGTYRIHIFANNGTEVAINHVRIRAQNSTTNIVTNGDFEMKQDVQINRDYPHEWQEESVHSNEYVLRPTNGILIVRGRYSPGLDFPIETNPILNNVLYMPLRSPTIDAGPYSLVVKANMAKKRPGPNIPTATVKILTTDGQVVYTTMLTNSQNIIDVPVSLQADTLYKLAFESYKGTEWEIDTLGIKRTNAPADQESSYITWNPFMTEYRTYQARTFQPSDWTAAPNNRNFGYSHVVKPDRGPMGAPFQNQQPFDNLNQGTGLEVN